MKRKLIAKRTGALALATAIATSSSMVNVFASDIEGHWAEGIMVAWQQKGLISGFTDGTLRPESVVTRAQFVSMLNNVLGFSAMSIINYEDVLPDDWFYTPVNVALTAGYATGKSATVFAPNAPVTREQAAVFVYKALGLSPGNPYVFTDGWETSTWARDAVGAMYQSGFIIGYGDGKFKPQSGMTRAEAVSFLDRVINGGVSTTTPSVTTPTVTTPTESTTTTTSGNVSITRPSTTLENQTIAGDLTITNTAMSGKIYLNNLTINGDLHIEGGGEIYLDDVIVKGTTYMNKTDVFVEVQGTTDLPTVHVLRSCHIDDVNYGGNIGYLLFANDISKSYQTILDVDIVEMEIDGMVSVAIYKDVDTLTVNEDGEYATVYLSTAGFVDEFIADAKLYITGTGEIDTLRANASGISVSTGLDIGSTKVASGVTAPTVGSVTGGSSGNSDSSGDSDSGNSGTGGSGTTTAAYTVGTGGTYGTIAAALEDIGSVADPVTIQLLSNVTESAPGIVMSIASTVDYQGSGDLTINTNGFTISGILDIGMAEGNSGTPKLSITGSGTVDALRFTGGELAVSSSLGTLAVMEATSVSVASANKVSIASLDGLSTLAISGTVANLEIEATDGVEESLAITGSGAITNVQINGTASTDASVNLSSTGTVGTVTTQVSTTLSGTGMTADTNVTVDTSTTTNTGQLTVVVPDVVPEANVTVNGDTGNADVENESGTTITPSVKLTRPTLTGATSALNGAEVILTVGTIPDDVKWYYTTNEDTPTTASLVVNGSGSTITVTGNVTNDASIKTIKIIAIDPNGVIANSSVLTHTIAFSVADLEEWTTELAKFDALVEADYTEESWAAFVATIQNATELTKLYTNEGVFTTPVGQTVIDAATAELTALLANSGLVEVNPTVPDETVATAAELTVKIEGQTVTAGAVNAVVGDTLKVAVSNYTNLASDGIEVNYSLKKSGSEVATDTISDGDEVTISDNLLAGEYTLEVTTSGDNLTSKTVTVTITVTDGSVVEPPTGDSTTASDVGLSGTATAVRTGDTTGTVTFTVDKAISGYKIVANATEPTVETEAQYGAVENALAFTDSTAGAVANTKETVSVTGLTVNAATATLHLVIEYTDTEQAKTYAVLPLLVAIPAEQPLIHDNESSSAVLQSAPVVGDTLKAVDSNGEALGSGVTVQWYADGVAISNATTATYTVARTDYDKVITVQVDNAISNATDEVVGQGAELEATTITAQTGVASSSGTVEISGGIVDGDYIEITTAVLAGDDTGTNVYISIEPAGDSTGGSAKTDYIVTIAIASDDDELTATELSKAVNDAIAAYNKTNNNVLGGLTLTFTNVTITGDTTEVGTLLSATEMEVPVISGE